MTLADGLKKGLVIASMWNESKVYVCAKCMRYLCRNVEGKYCFSCSCHNGLLESGV